MRRFRNLSRHRSSSLNNRRNQKKAGKGAKYIRLKKEPLKSTLRKVESFQETFFVALFKDFFASCRGLGPHEVPPCQIKSLEKLWGLISGKPLDSPIGKEEALSLKAYFLGFDHEGAIPKESGRGMGRHHSSLPRFLFGGGEAMSDLLGWAKEKFQGFFGVFHSNGKGKCLLMGEHGETLYVVVSGLFDSPNPEVSQNESYKHSSLIPNLKDQIERMLQEPFFESGSKPQVEFVRATDRILYKKASIDGDYGHTYSFASLYAASDEAGKVAPGVARHYFCCERKLVAYAREKGIGLMNFRYLLRRYLPCEECYWAVDGLQNFYVFGNGEVSRVIIPENIAIPKNEENDASLCYEWVGPAVLDSKIYLAIGPNYLFFKESI
jgi:hypothetical protein